MILWRRTQTDVKNSDKYAAATYERRMDSGAGFRYSIEWRRPYNFPFSLCGFGLVGDSSCAWDVCILTILLNFTGMRS